MKSTLPGNVAVVVATVAAVGLSFATPLAPTVPEPISEFVYGFTDRGSLQVGRWFEFDDRPLPAELVFGEQDRRALRLPETSFPLEQGPGVVGAVVISNERSYSGAPDDDYCLRGNVLLIYPDTEMAEVVIPAGECFGQYFRGT